MRIFLPRFKKPCLEAEQSALKDKNCHCVTLRNGLIGNKKQKNSEKGRRLLPSALKQKLFE